MALLLETGDAFLLEDGEELALESDSGPITLELSHANKVLRFTGTDAEVIIPLESSVDFPEGTILTLRQAGTGTLVLTTTGLTINGTVPTWAQHVEVQFRKVGADEWDVI